MSDHPTRRFLLTGTFASCMGLRVGDPAWAEPNLPPTPACADNDAPTLKQSEGPFFKPSSPERFDLREQEIGRASCRERV